MSLCLILRTSWSMALALTGYSLTISSSGQPVHEPRPIKHHSALSDNSGPGRPDLELPTPSDGVVTAQPHKQRVVVRREADIANVLLEVNKGGIVQTEQAASVTPDLMEPVVATKAFPGWKPGSTPTTTLSAFHLMSSTVMEGLASPPVNELGHRSTSPVPMRSTTEEIVSERVAEPQFSEMAADRAAQDPVLTSAQVPDALAAFEVSGAGVDAFNGIYMIEPAETNTAGTACTSLVWDMRKNDVLYALWNSGSWQLMQRGQSATYNGADGGSCEPESASWASVAPAGGAAPTVTRKTAADYTTPAPTPVPYVGAPTPAPMTQEYFVVAGAGETGFNGVYYRTPLLVQDQRCQATFAKGGASNTDYTLAFFCAVPGQSPCITGNWVLQSLINGVQSRPYYLQDGGNCNPETGAWAVKPDTPASMTAAGTAPTVELSFTATTTTTTTTSTTTKAANTTTQTRSLYVFTTTTTTTPCVSNATYTCPPTAAPTPSPLTEAPTTTTNSDFNVKAKGNRGFSSWWLRLLLPIVAAFALRG